MHQIATIDEINDNGNDNTDGKEYFSKSHMKGTLITYDR